MRSENVPKTRVSCCQIATMLAPLKGIWVAEYDGIVDI